MIHARVAFKKFAAASLASGDPMSFYHWADTYLYQSRIVTDYDKKVYLLRNACDTFRTAHTLRKKDITFMCGFMGALVELADTVKAEAVKLLFEVIEIYARRVSRISSSKGTIQDFFGFCYRY